MEEAGFSLAPGEALLDEKQVTKVRTAARKTKNEAAGRLASAEERLTDLQSSEPPLPALYDTAVLEHLAQWEAYDREVGDAGARGAAETAQRDWDKRRDELGEEPALDEKYRTCGEQAKAAKKAQKAAQGALQEATSAHQVVASRVAEFEGQDPSICPTCERPGWAAGVQAYERVQEESRALQAKVETARGARDAASDAFDRAMEFLQEGRDAKGKRDGWREALKALGPRPEAPPVSEGTPASPTAPRPSAAEIEQARAKQREYDGAQGARERWAADLDQARQQVRQEVDNHAETEQKSARLDALLEAVRKAPSVVAERQALALGHMGPVSLKFGENPAVEVLIDGRPWWLASRGRCVVADIWLRDALRRAMDKEFLPIIVDNVQDVGGQPLPEVEGPMVIMRTTHDKKISVDTE